MAERVHVDADTFIQEFLRPLANLTVAERLYPAFRDRLAAQVDITLSARSEEQRKQRFHAMLMGIAAAMEHGILGDPDRAGEDGLQYLLRTCAKWRLACIESANLVLRARGERADLPLGYWSPERGQIGMYRLLDPEVSGAARLRIIRAEGYITSLEITISIEVVLEHYRSLSS